MCSGRRSSCSRKAKDQVRLAWTELEERWEERVPLRHRIWSTNCTGLSGVWVLLKRLGAHWRDLDRRTAHRFTNFSLSPFLHYFSQFSTMITDVNAFSPKVHFHYRERGIQKIQLIHSWVFEAIRISSLFTSLRRPGSPWHRKHGRDRKN